MYVCNKSRSSKLRKFEFLLMDCVSLSEVKSSEHVLSFDDVVSLLSSTRHDGTSRYWWRIKSSGQVLYGKFDVESPNKELRLHVMNFASATPSRAAELIRNEIISTKWVDVMKPPFD